MVDNMSIMCDSLNSHCYVVFYLGYIFTTRIFSLDSILTKRECDAQESSQSCYGSVLTTLWI